MLEPGQSGNTAAIIISDRVRFFCEVIIMDKYYVELLELMNKAYDMDEVPVAAIVVKDGEIIGRGYNQRINKCSVLGHAEIIAIEEAEQAIGDWRLSDCDLYVTLEPCNMCKEIIKESRIKNVFYITKKLDFKKGFYKTNICSCDNMLDNDKIVKINNKLTEFFERKTNR